MLKTIDSLDFRLKKYFVCNFRPSFNETTDEWYVLFVAFHIYYLWLKYVI